MGFMNHGLRLLRGFATTALLWGAAWAIAGAKVSFLFRRFASPGSDLPLIMASWQQAAGIFGIIGALNGGVFALAVIIGERRRSFAELSPARMALWGLMGGVSYPMLFTVRDLFIGRALPNDWFVAVPVCALFGAASAWGMLKIARRAKDDSPAQLGGPSQPETTLRQAERVAR
jgi:hypothetical protein